MGSTPPAHKIALQSSKDERVPCGFGEIYQHAVERHIQRRLNFTLGAAAALDCDPAPILPTCASQALVGSGVRS